MIANRFILLIVVVVTARAACGESDVSRPESAVAESPVAGGNPIDLQTFAQLAELQLEPSPPTTDAEFLRRVTLTATGQLPTPQDVRSFLADERSDKRSAKIDELLASPLHAAVWATRFSQMTGNSVDALEGPDELKAKRAKMWHDWLRRQFEANVPYDQIVRRILTAISRESRPVDEWIDDEAGLVRAARSGFDSAYAERESLDLFWRRTSNSQPYPLEEMAERVASNFLGVRIGCARCHQHPFDRWTQQDYRAFANIFGQVRFDMSPELRETMSQRLEDRRKRQAEGETPSPLPRVSEVYLAAASYDLRDDATGKPIAAKALGGPVVSQDGNECGDRRVALMNWLNEPGNPYFAKNIVNRAWAMHFGRGLLEPLDGFSAANPAIYPKLLDELAADFVAHGYDLRRLERLILNSQTWQLSSTPNDSNRNDADHFSRAYVRPLPPETLVDAWHAAVGVPAEFGNDVPRGARAVEIAPSRVAEEPWNRLLTVFGRPTRVLPCDCEPPPGPSIRQTLALMCDSSLLVQLPKGRVKELIDAKADDNEVVDDLFLRTVSRYPEDDERATALAALTQSADRARTCEDLLWSLINTQEFVTNH